MTCRIEELARMLPKGQRLSPEPTIDIVREILDLNGDVYCSELGEDGRPEFLNVRVMLPVPMRVARDLSAAVDIEAWWPSFRQTVRDAITNCDALAVVGQTDQPSSDGNAPLSLLLAVILPIPMAVMKPTPDVPFLVDQIVTSVNKGAAVHLREYQVAWRMAHDA